MCILFLTHGAACNTHGKTAHNIIQLMRCVIDYINNECFKSYCMPLPVCVCMVIRMYIDTTLSVLMQSANVENSY